MANPLRSEAAAFNLLLGVLVYMVPIGVAAVVGGPWAGLGVFVVVTVAALLLLVRGRRDADAGDGDDTAA